MNDSHHFKFSPTTWLLPSLLLFLIGLVFYLSDRFNLSLTAYGILPRSLTGLRGVLLSPFLHADLRHLANNSVPLFVLTTALIYFYREVSLKVLVYGILLSGTITWIIGRDAYHIGASGLVYVLVSFIFFKGLMTQYYRLIALSLAVVMVYGGMIWYVFPDIDRNISWEGHLAGFITGFVFAARFKTPDYVKATRYNWERPDFNPETDPFMKHFDENGNFVNTPAPDLAAQELTEELPGVAIRYVYVANGSEEEKKTQEDH